MGNKRPQFQKMVEMILASTSIIVIIVMLVGLIARWSEPVQFNNDFFAAGAILIVLDFLFVSGGFSQRGNFNMTYAESADQANLQNGLNR